MEPLSAFLYFGLPTTVGLIGLMAMKLHEWTAPSESAREWPVDRKFRRIRDREVPFFPRFSRVAINYPGAGGDEKAEFTVSETGRTTDVHVAAPPVPNTLNDAYRRFLRISAPDADPETYQLAPHEMDLFAHWLVAESANGSRQGTSKQERQP